MASDQIRLLILYGTSTGTAREVALRIAREAYCFKRVCYDYGDIRFFIPEVLSMKDISVKDLTERSKDSQTRIIFVVSTTGQGEFPDEAKDLWRALCRKNAVVTEIPIHYAVIGLGDSSYELYNYPAKKLYRRLQQLKGIPCADLCLCDDQHDLGYIGALNPFLEQCWSTWVPDEYNQARDSLRYARYSLFSGEKKGSYSPLSENEFPRFNIQRRPVIKNDRVTSADHIQDTRLIAFDISDCNFLFEAGDAVQVYAENFPENVDLFFEIFPGLRNQQPIFIHCDPELSWEKIPDQMFQICGPMPWTWEQIATQLLDLQSIPGTYVFEILRSFTEDPLVKEKFAEFCRPEGLEELYNYVNRPRRTIIEVLKDFCYAFPNFPANYIFDLIPFMRPRAFSIASPPNEEHHIEILVAVVEYKTNLKIPRRGTCSYWLANFCNFEQKVAIFIDKGSLRVPTVDSHMIMIGPGTGIAPFRSMIKQHEKEWDKHLFFGCRGRNKDYYFGEELEALVEAGSLCLYNAFSRDKDGKKVDYVQDVVLRQTSLIKSMLESPLPIYIYVCGRSGDMPKDVFSAFKQILQQVGVQNPDEFLKHMLLTGQYQAETY